jgi:hypothetical protein
MPRMFETSSRQVRPHVLCLCFAIPLVFLASGCEKSQLANPAPPSYPAPVNQLRTGTGPVCGQGTVVPFAVATDIPRLILVCQNDFITWNHTATVNPEFTVQFSSNNPFSPTAFNLTSSSGLATTTRATPPPASNYYAAYTCNVVLSDGTSAANVHIIVLGQ